eukprot:6907595-Prymnesium_polylepis.1
MNINHTYVTCRQNFALAFRVWDDNLPDLRIVPAFLELSRDLALWRHTDANCPVEASKCRTEEA